MADNPKSLASTSQTPLHEQLRRFIENVRAHPGEIESSEYSITTPISWDGLGYAMHPLAAFEEMADALEAAAALRAPTIARPVTDEMVEACAKSLLTSSADYPGAYHAWLNRTDSAWVVLRAALKAALATPPTEEKVE